MKQPRTTPIPTTPRCQIQNPRPPPRILALLLIRYGVIAREERYLTRRFGDNYRHFCHHVRRWL